MKSRLLSSPRAAMLLWAAVAWCGALFVGCATTGDHESDLPWNTPQSWEGSPSIPGFEDR